MSHEESIGLFRYLNDIGITYHVFIDIIYFIEVIVNHIDYIDNCSGHHFIDVLKTAVATKPRHFFSYSGKIL